MRTYAEAHSDAWYILSAEHGLLHPTQVTAPYERTLNRMRIKERQAWAERVQTQLVTAIPIGAHIVVLAGERYREYLPPFLHDRGHSVEVPLAGLSLGRQLSRLNELLARHGE